MKNRNIPVIVGLIAILFFTACQEEFLDLKSDKKLVVPTTLKDFRALMDNSDIMNNSSVPYLGEVSADDYYMSTENFMSISGSTVLHNSYIWASDIYGGEHQLNDDWARLYQMVLYCNVVLEGLEKLPHNALSGEWKEIKGTAYFFRSWAFYQLAQLFCVQYDAVTASEDIGIPIRLHADIKVKASRNTVAETYRQIISDLSNAVKLLPPHTLFKTRPGGDAAYAMLAKVYLQMGDYEAALDNAGESLSIYDGLLDFNSIDTALAYPFEMFNKEVIFHAVMRTNSIFRRRLNVDTSLYRLYAENDIRKQAFFQQGEEGITYKGSYNGDYKFFGGISVAEVYLIKAECNARLNKTGEALMDLQQLWRNRVSNYHDPLEIDQDSMLNIVLEERRKELVFRGIRWADLRRLNKEPRFSKTLIRKVDGKEYRLLPNDPKYVFPIPPTSVSISGLEQNPR